MIPHHPENEISCLGCRSCASLHLPSLLVTEPESPVFVIFGSDHPIVNWTYLQETGRCNDRRLLEVLFPYDVHHTVVHQTASVNAIKEVQVVKSVQGNLEHANRVLQLDEKLLHVLKFMVLMKALYT